MENSLREIHQRTLKDTLEFVEAQSDQYITCTTRPGSTERITTWSDLSPSGGKGVAIVIHGDIIYDDHFTRDTIRLYRKHYPNVLIILYPWAEYDEEYVEALSEEGIVIVTEKNEQGKRLSWLDIAREGLKKKKISHLLLTSTNLRLYAPNVIETCLSLQQCFPLREGVSAKGRMIGTGYGTRKFWPHCLEQSCMFGHVEDMLSYWIYTPQKIPRDPEQNPNAMTVRERATHTPEFQWAINYLKQRGMPHEMSIRESWRAYTSLFCLVDDEMLDVYEYEAPDAPVRPKGRRGAQYELRADAFMSFRDWMLLYTQAGLIDSTPEYILDLNAHVALSRRKS